MPSPEEINLIKKKLDEIEKERERRIVESTSSRRIPEPDPDPLSRAQMFEAYKEPEPAPEPTKEALFDDSNLSPLAGVTRSGFGKYLSGPSTLKKDSVEPNRKTTIPAWQQVTKERKLKKATPKTESASEPTPAPTQHTQETPKEIEPSNEFVGDKILYKKHRYVIKEAPTEKNGYKFRLEREDGGGLLEPTEEEFEAELIPQKPPSIDKEIPTPRSVEENLPPPPTHWNNETEEEPEPRSARRLELDEEITDAERELKKIERDLAEIRARRKVREAMVTPDSRPKKGTKTFEEESLRSEDEDDKSKEATLLERRVKLRMIIESVKKEIDKVAGNFSYRTLPDNTEVQFRGGWRAESRKFPRKVSEVATESYHPNGKVAEKRYHDGRFKVYNETGEMTYQTNEEGQEIPTVDEQREERIAEIQARLDSSNLRKKETTPDDSTARRNQRVDEIKAKIEKARNDNKKKTP